MSVSEAPRKLIYVPVGTYPGLRESIEQTARLVGLSEGRLTAEALLAFIPTAHEKLVQKKIDGLRIPQEAQR